MEKKQNHRLPSSADRKAAYEAGAENELRRRLQLMGPAGIVSSGGADVDNDSAACALSINAQDSNAIDVVAGTVLFANGEYIDVALTDIQAKAIDASISEGQVFRLTYGEVTDGTLEANPFYNFAAQPTTRKQTAAEMLVVETVTAYNAQPSTVKDISVVLGVVRIESGALTVDNGRDTYTFSRPWASVQDAKHRSKVGSGLVTNNNIHGMALGDLTVGNYTAWQALTGGPGCVLARPNGVGRYPGEVCTETIPAGAFATDTTGLISGVAGALYAPLGFWPDRMLRASLTSASTTQVAAWIPKGRNVVAVLDPNNFAAAVSLGVVYTKVTAGSLPSSLTGLQTLTVGQPTAEELIVAGGNFITELVENKVLFTDVGLIPMKFDILVDGTGRAYKSPDVVYCNTALSTLGTTAQPFTIQPSSPTRLRVAISNYVVGFTEVRILISGTDETGATISETAVFSGPGVLIQPSFQEVTDLRLFLANTFAVLGQIQVTVRNGDGANTTVTVFAEQSPERPATQDDLLLGTVQWTGSEVTSLYVNDADVAIDRRLVTTGGGSKGLSPVSSALDSPMLVDSVLGYLPPATTKWATLVEDFSDPEYMEYPNSFDAVQGSQQPIGLNSNSHGIRNGYLSRLIPFGGSFSGAALDSLWMRGIAKGMRGFPARVPAVAFTVTLHDTTGADIVLTASLGANPYPPYQFQLTGAALVGNYFGATISLVPTASIHDLSEAFQGFIFHIRE